MAAQHSGRSEFKVALEVKMDELGLTPEEQRRLAIIVGPRYDWDSRRLRLVAERYPSRVENQRYLVYLLENLLLEARGGRPHEQLASE